MAARKPRAKPPGKAAKRKGAKAHRRQMDVLREEVECHVMSGQEMLDFIGRLGEKEVAHDP